MGAVALALQRRTEPPAHPHDPSTVRAPMPWAVLVPLTVAATALGSLFGAQEVATVALAGDAGHKAVSGLMLGAFALASGLAGVVAGAMHVPPHVRCAGRGSDWPCSPWARRSSPCSRTW